MMASQPPDPVHELVRHLGRIVNTIGNYIRKLDELEQEVAKANQILQGKDVADVNVRKAKEFVAHIQGFIQACEQRSQMA